MSTIECLVTLFWTVAIIVPILIKVASVLSGGKFSSLLRWGKTLQTKEDDLLLVPHRYFTYFYMTGFLFNFVCLVDLIFQQHTINTIISPVDSITSSTLSTLGLYTTSDRFLFSPTQPLLPSLLLHLQLTRRLLESVLIVRHDTSKMHISHLLFALCYYPALSLSTNLASTPVSSTTAVFVIALFTWASYHQFTCHSILADLRACSPGAARSARAGQVKSGYGVPYGDWFQYVSSPHYLAEIIIYLGIFVSAGGNSLLGLNCVYQIVNFSVICTPPTHQWYQEKFEEYPRDRKILIPFIY